MALIFHGAITTDSKFSKYVSGLRLWGTRQFFQYSYLLNNMGNCATFYSVRIMDEHVLHILDSI